MKLICLQIRIGVVYCGRVINTIKVGMCVTRLYIIDVSFLHEPEAEDAHMKVTEMIREKLRKHQLQSTMMRITILGFALRVNQKRLLSDKMKGFVFPENSE